MTRSTYSSDTERRARWSKRQRQREQVHEPPRWRFDRTSLPQLHAFVKERRIRMPRDIHCYVDVYDSGHLNRRGKAHLKRQLWNYLSHRRFIVALDGTH
jgi:hypothetical protein